MIPVTCIDDFYQNPDSIREWALSLSYQKLPGNYPGSRTEPLYKIDEDFYNNFIGKVLSLFYDDNRDFTHCKCEVFFQKIFKKSDNPMSLMNHGWAHLDEKPIDFAGVIYLNPNPSSFSGTTICIPNRSELELDYSIRNKLYSENSICEQDYINAIEKHNSQFDDSIVVSNKYNRLICFDNQTWHRESNFFMESEDFRLTQVFFMWDLKAPSYPSKRSRYHVY